MQLPTAMSFIAIVFAAAGEWMIGAWIANKRRSSTRQSVAHWSAGAFVIGCAVALLAISVGMLLSSGTSPSPVFWVGVGLVLELPVVIAFVVTWPWAMRWSMTRSTLNPPFTFLAAGMLGALIGAGVFLVALVVARI